MYKFMKQGTLMLATLILATSYVNAAAIYNFDITYDGTSASIDAGSDPIAGTTLVAGDSYVLDIHAAGNDYWNVTNTFNTGIYASFLIFDSGNRVSDVTTNFFLDNVLVDQDIDMSLNQGSVHIGAQGHIFTAGL
ncbi:hypothetical protein [Aliiglaciecola litoralis]|uniref:Uncharacterized protein n=1 Tax=Aliiglaciecola litoralis TaxID=582857 RepID=A0ABP3WXB0_9ALTE